MTVDTLSKKIARPAKWRYEQRLATIEEGDEEAALAEERKAPAPAPRPAPRPAPAPAAAPSPSRPAPGSWAAAVTGGAAAAPAPPAPAAPVTPDQALTEGVNALAAAGRSYAQAAAAAAGLAPPPAQRPAPAQAAQRPNCLIKGNINQRGEKIYHLPSSGTYADTKIEESRGEKYFCTEAEAKAAGFRPSVK
jgi:hypothetical protein